MTIYTYSPQDVVLQLGGYTVEGFADGTFISIEPESKYLTSKRTSSGYISRTLKKTQIKKLKLSLHQTSESNSILNTLFNLDLAFADAIVPAFLKDYSTGTSIIIGQLWIDSLPTMSYANGLETWDWELCFTTDIISISGGEGESAYEQFLSVLSSGIPSILNVKQLVTTAIGDFV